MKHSKHLGDFTVRAIDNGFIVSKHADLRRGGDIPREHFCQTATAVGEFIADETRKSQRPKDEDNGL